MIPAPRSPLPAPRFNAQLFSVAVVKTRRPRQARSPALGFLKLGGTLVAIRPATAHYDLEELKGQWTDLPVGSFAEVGTSVPTGILKISKATA